jgi:hypothetical protein
MEQQQQLGEFNESPPAHVDSVNPKYATPHNEFLYTSHREQNQGSGLLKSYDNKRPGPKRTNGVFPVNPVD